MEQYSVMGKFRDDLEAWNSSQKVLGVGFH